MNFTDRRIHVVIYTNFFFLQTNSPLNVDIRTAQRLTDRGVFASSTHVGDYRADCICVVSSGDELGIMLEHPISRLRASLG